MRENGRPVKLVSRICARHDRRALGLAVRRGVGAWWLALVLAGCSAQKSTPPGDPNVPPPPVTEVLARHTPELMKLSGVVGTYEGECDGTPCIKVMVAHRDADLERRIPKTLEGYRVEIDVTGEIRALPDTAR
jgi:hypothetical protein